CTLLCQAEDGILVDLVTGVQTCALPISVELLKSKAADGQTDLYGMLHFPSNFKPYKKYPLLVSVYAGPGTSAARETFTLPNALKIGRASCRGRVPCEGVL